MTKSGASAVAAAKLSSPKPVPQGREGLALTPTQQKVVDQLRDGQRIARELLEDGEIRLFMSGTGKAVRRQTFRAIYRKGILKSSEDGLFPGFTQTFELVD